MSSPLPRTPVPPATCLGSGCPEGVPRLLSRPRPSDAGGRFPQSAQFAHFGSAGPGFRAFGALAGAGGSMG
jgi:hypothetical protein